MFINLNGLRVRYKCLGEGFPILLLHGWGGQIENFALLQTHLAQYRKVYVLDFPGFGRSDFPSCAWSVGNYAELVVEFLNKIELVQVDVLGHSFGGRVAIKLATQWPERVSRLILVNSAGVHQYKMSWRYKLIAKFADFGKPLINLLPVDVRKKIRLKFYHAIGSMDYLTAGRLQETYSKVIAEDLEPFLSGIQVQTLLLWGAKDQATPLEDGRLMGKKIPNATLVVLPNAGHFSFLDEPDKTNQILDNFLLQK